MSEYTDWNLNVAGKLEIGFHDFRIIINLRHANNPKMNSPKYDTWQKFLGPSIFPCEDRWTIHAEDRWIAACIKRENAKKIKELKNKERTSSTDWENEQNVSLFHDEETTDGNPEN